MKPKTFTEYLNSLHANERPYLLDDDMPDDFNNWLEQFDVNDILEMVGQYENL